MPRPQKLRTIRDAIPVRFFKPQGVPMRALETVVLSRDGLEALRLADAEGLEHADAAEMMGISRPTFSRLLAQARTAVARALTGEMAIRIEGGTVAEAAPVSPGCGGRGWGCGGRRRGRRGRPGKPGGTFTATEDDDAQS